MLRWYVAIVFIGVIVSTSSGAIFLWNASSTNRWSNRLNWERVSPYQPQMLPGPADDVTIPASVQAPVVWYYDTFTHHNANIYKVGVHNYGSLTFTGDMCVYGSFYVGTMTGADFEVDGVVNVSNFGTPVAILELGTGAQGTVHGEVGLGAIADTQGKLVLSGTTTKLQMNALVVGKVSTGIVDHSDGTNETWNFSTSSSVGTNIKIGYATGSKGTYVFSGGTITSNFITVGAMGQGRFDLRSSTATIDLVNSSGRFTLGTGGTLAIGYTMTDFSSLFNGQRFTNGNANSFVGATDGTFEVTNDSTVTCPSNVSIGTLRIGSPKDVGATTPNGTFALSGGNVTLNVLEIGKAGTGTTGTDGTGTLSITSAGAGITVNDKIHFGPESVFSGPSSGLAHITIVGKTTLAAPAKLENANIYDATNNPTPLVGLGSLELTCNSTGTGYVALEAAGAADVTDFSSPAPNFLIDTLIVGSTTWTGKTTVNTQDANDNQGDGADNDVLYVRNLDLRPGATLDLANKPALYYLRIPGDSQDNLRRLYMGDANLSGTVTDADYTLWADNYDLTATGKKWSQGDFNGDGKVTDADYTIWADNYGAGTDQGMRATSQSTSEATSETLEEEEPTPPAVTYTTVDLGDGLTGYTFSVEDAAEASWAVDLTFSGVDGATIQQRLAFPDICDIVVDFSDDADWYDSRPLAEYSKELDTWALRPYFYPLLDGVAENPDGSYHTHLCTLGGEAYGSLNVVYIVSDGDVSWEGNVARQGMDYAVSGSTAE